MPKVTVIIPTYNSAKYIAEALDSVFAQTYRDFEVIVVDDGSTDDTADVTKDYIRSMVNSQQSIDKSSVNPRLDQRDSASKKIRYFYQENQGVAKARLHALKEAQGEYIATLDADDLWSPDKLRQQAEFLDRCREIDMVITDFHNFRDIEKMKDSYFTGNPVRKIKARIFAPDVPEYKIFEGDIMYEYLQGNFILQSTLMMRTAVCRHLDIFNTSQNPREMYEYCTRNLHKLKIGVIDKPMVKRRLHENNLTLDSGKVMKATIEVCERAKEYPWMSPECRRFLVKEAMRSHYRLGRIYFKQARFLEAKKEFKKALAIRINHLRGLLFFILAGVIAKKERYD
ncbi:MAG: glycosyltransferase family 2 protein [Candidatus Omnitrophica bacterium]|nr:glycosyltransferase family 2 protein [Candidatus Omnitrophota bacterium]